VRNVADKEGQRGSPHLTTKDAHVVTDCKDGRFYY